MAVRLGTEPEYRDSLRSLIRERNETLFEDRELVRQYEQFFEQALARAKGQE